MNSFYTLTIGLILVIICISGKVQAQIKKASYLPDTFCITTTRPLLLTQGNTVTLDCDSAYLINKFRYRLYQRLHRHMQQQDHTFDTLINTYENSLQDAERAYRQLLEKYHHSDQIAQHMLDSTQTSLLHLNQTLQQTESTLLSAQQDLRETKQMLQQARRRAFIQKACIGLGGLGVGVLTGLVLGH